MKCLHCDGKGNQDKKAFGNEICPYCDGTGNIIQTNEEWFNRLSTETKARIAHLVYMAGYRDGFNEAKAISLQDIIEWLKEKHG